MTEPVISGADAVAAALEEIGVEIVFGITGAGNLAICDAIYRRGATRLVFVHHEQAAVMAAQGMSRTTGKLGVALVTTGGGSTNALTGIVGANMDSIPILLISGNESSVHTTPDNELRIWGVQGFDSRAVFSPVAKESHRIRSSDQIHSVLVNAAHTAMQPRQGVVTVDVPMDLQRKTLTAARQPSQQITAAASAFTKVDYSAAVEAGIQLTLEALRRSARPVILLGAGLRTGTARDRVREQVAALGIPALVSWSAIDLLDADHPMNFGRSGIYGDRYANMIVQNADLVISIGSRLAIPQLSYDPMDFSRNSRIIVVDIDQRELEKFVGDRWVPVKADASQFLDRLAIQAGAHGETALPTGGGVPNKMLQWVDKCTALRASFPRRAQTDEAVPAESRNDYLNSYNVVYEISDQAGPSTIFTTDMGTGLLAGFYGLDLREQQKLSTSLGLGEMGYGLPAAIGAQFANTDETVVCLNADGGMMLNLQELQTIAHHQLPIKLVVFSNDGYLMIKHSQRNLFDGRFVGSDKDSGISVPNFAKLADTFGLAYLALSSTAVTKQQVAAFFAAEGPVLLEVFMHPEQLFIPRVGTIKGEAGKLISPPLEDMIPLISEAALSAAMDGALHNESLNIRSSPSSLPTLGDRS